MLKINLINEIISKQEKQKDVVHAKSLRNMDEILRNEEILQDESAYVIITKRIDDSSLVLPISSRLHAFHPPLSNAFIHNAWAWAKHYIFRTQSFTQILKPKETK